MNHDSVKLGLELLEELNKREKKIDICKECQMSEQFGKKCWFYWENKKFCSQNTGNI